MHSNVAFKSNNYQKIEWHNLLNKCYQGSAIDDYSVLLNHNWIIVPKNLLVQNKLTLLTPEKIYSIDLSSVDFIAHQFLLDCGIKIARIVPQLLVNVQKTSTNNYIYVCQSICKEAIRTVNKILIYTYDHLCQREAEGTNLAQHEAIRLSIADVVCQLETASNLLHISNNLGQLSLVSDYLLNALQLLSKLGGARAILREHAVELIFHLRVFQSVYLFD